MSVSQNGKSYWRSLERHSGSAEVDPGAPAPGEEFPLGASDTPDGVSRRTMMSLMGASFAMAGLVGCRRPVETIVPYVSAPEGHVNGIAKYFATTMPLGNGAYGVVAESHEGRPSKVEGNELHPSSQGAANAWTQASVLGLYDPDRSRRVLHRGESGELKPSSWADFDAAWQERLSSLQETGGRDLAVLAGAHSSPSLSRVAAALREQLPDARWVTYEPIGDDNIFNGSKLATGEALQPVYHLEKAQVIVSLDADFLHSESNDVAYAKGFAASRRVDNAESTMSRLYVAEATLSVTGAAAEHRLRMKSSEVAGLAVAIATSLAARGLPLEAPAGAPGELAEKADKITADLAAAGSAGVVIAGRRQPPEVHALALAINQALGAVGETVTLHPIEDSSYGDPAALAALTGSMGQGEISTLVILGGNPAYDAPTDLDFVTAREAVEQVIHLGDRVDETSHLANWHLPLAHYLEAWGDARSADGTVSLIQPLIQPLFDGRSALEIAGQLTTGEARPGHELVRDTWSANLGNDLADLSWRRALHDGRLEGSALPAASPTIDGAAVASAAAGLVTNSDGMELSFRVSPSTYDGRFNNSSWLQETPDPISKIVWDNAAFISPATASRLGFETGDVARLTYREREIEAPVFVLPGQADDSIAVELGFGRTAAGRVGNGVGYNAYRLRTSAAPWFDGSLAVSATGTTYELVQTQEHWDMESRPLVREATLAHYREHPDFTHTHHAVPIDLQLWPAHDYSQGPQWGMSIDLNACIGCNACLLACQSENNISVVGKEQVSRGREMHWLRLDRYFAGEADDPEVVYQPVPCMHCENAPCEQVCPVAATVHDREGINAMVYNRCIGTRYCSNNCPYKVRRFNFFNYTKDTPELAKMANNPDVTVRSRGVMEKCTYCIQRISEAKIVAKRAERPLQDGAAKTACQQTCPTDAIVFGDIRDPASQVTQAKAQDRDYVMLEELNNRPRTSYRAKLRNPNPDWA